MYARCDSCKLLCSLNVRNLIPYGSRHRTCWHYRSSSFEIAWKTRSGTIRSRRRSSAATRSIRRCDGKIRHSVVVGKGNRVVVEAGGPEVWPSAKLPSQLFRVSPHVHIFEAIALRLHRFAPYTERHANQRFSKLLVRQVLRPNSAFPIPTNPLGGPLLSAA